MNPRIRSSAPWLPLLWSLAGFAGAEVRVQDGELLVESRAGLTWAPAPGGAADADVLNPFGDARGDSPPALARNPRTGAFEATWGLGGPMPGLVFSRHSEEGGWQTTRVPAARSDSRWGGRTPSLAHDGQGNSYLLYEDPESGQVLLASVARDSLRVNPPLVLATPQRPGTSPAMLWDGEALVVAFVRADALDRLEVHGLEPEWDEDGRIPEGGEAIPGIPEPIFGPAAAAGLGSAASLGGGAAPSLGGLNGAQALDLTSAPPLLRLESIDEERLLVTWIAHERLYWSQRSGGAWSEPEGIPLTEPWLHEEARERLRAALGGRALSGAARSWTRETRWGGAPASGSRRR